MPWQSTQFGYYKPGCGANSACKDTVAWQDSYLVQKELVPLKAMNASGKLTIADVPNMKHTNWVYGYRACASYVTKYYAHLL